MMQPTGFNLLEWPNNRIVRQSGHGRAGQNCQSRNKWRFRPWISDRKIIHWKKLRRYADSSYPLWIGSRWRCRASFYTQYPWMIGNFGDKARIFPTPWACGSWWLRLFRFTMQRYCWFSKVKNNWKAKGSTNFHFELTDFAWFARDATMIKQRSWQVWQTLSNGRMTMGELIPLATS